MEAVRRAIKQAGDVAVDRYLGIDSAGDIYHEDLEFGPEGGDHRYGPTNWLSLIWLRRALERFGPSPADTFIDFGAGKGRVVLVAAGLPFGSVIGVELSPGLARVGQDNIDRNRHRIRSGDVRIVEADMGTFPIPDDLAIAFMLNPSEGPAFTAAVEAIGASLERRPRRFRLIYGNPIMHGQLLAAGFRPVQRPRLLNSTVYDYAGRAS